MYSLDLVKPYLNQPWHNPEHQENEKIQAVVDAMITDESNSKFTQVGIKPLLSIHENARIVIVGQAPGHFAQDTMTPWNDPSGDKLRKWMGIGRETFYTTDLIAIMNMDAYFPGVGKSGDLPPRKDFASKWHPQLLKLMPNVELIITVGSYATKHYLHLKSSDRLTDVVRNFEDYAPKYFPLVHPSGRNQIWMSKNPWFEKDVLVQFRARVSELLDT